MAHILHLDSSAAKTIVLLSENGIIIQSRHHNGARDGAAVINALVENVLSAADINMTALAAIAVCTGPGSYTGLRIALATAKGLAYALDLPIIAHDRLTLGLKFAEAAAPLCDFYLAIIPARTGEYFVAAKDAATTVLPQQLMLTAAVEAALNAYSDKRIAVWGAHEPDISFNNEVVSLPFLYPDDCIWATLTFEKYSLQDFADAALLEPAYLKTVFISTPSSQKDI